MKKMNLRLEELRSTHDFFLLCHLHLPASSMNVQQDGLKVKLLVFLEILSISEVLLIGFFCVGSFQRA